MKKILMCCLLTVASTAYAEDPEWPSWYTNLSTTDLWGLVIRTNPSVVVILISANDVDLFISVGKRNRNKEGPLYALFQVRDLTGRPLERNDVEDYLMPNGVFCCQNAEGTIWRTKIPPVFHYKTLISGPPTIPPGDTQVIGTRFNRPLPEWFEALKTKGRYLLWWEYRGKRSNIVTVEQTGNGLRLIE